MSDKIENEPAEYKEKIYCPYCVVELDEITIFEEDETAWCPICKRFCIDYFSNEGDEQ